VLTVIVCIFQRITGTCGKLAQMQSTHIYVLLFVLPTVIRYTSRHLLCYTTHTLDWISSKIYTHKLTLNEDERITLRQLCKRLCKRQDGTSAQQQTATHSSSLRGLWRPATPHTDIRYMNNSVLRLLGPLEIEASSPCSRPLTYPWNRWLQAS